MINKLKCKVIMLPTDNKSRLVITMDKELKITPFAGHAHHPQCLCFVSDREINDSDWFVHNKKLIHCKYTVGDKSESYSVYDNNDTEYLSFNCNKVEGTTDSSLYIGEYTKLEKERFNCPTIPQIPHSFMEDFVKINGNIKEVNIETQKACCKSGQILINCLRTCKDVVYIPKIRENFVITK